ncbi:unnamed protein product [Mytilus coruscus]|uniref:Uncharacterized protein n=1 Tax=Mytilus coruscus TaxID=42192 RepID=A0A6J8AB32_MYTCO|nr:unnamed protein product [Mytilus coruscus]
MDVLETKHENKKVVLHLHKATILLHIQGTSCLHWFKTVLSDKAMEIHNMLDSALFNEENSLILTSNTHELDTSDTDTKMMFTHNKSSDTTSNSIVYTSCIEIPCGYGTPVRSTIPKAFSTPKDKCSIDNPMIQSLISEVESLREQCNLMSSQLALIINKEVASISPQTDDCVKINKHTQFTKVEKKESCSRTTYHKPPKKESCSRTTYHKPPNKADISEHYLTIHNLNEKEEITFIEQKQSKDQTEAQKT